MSLHMSLPRAILAFIAAPFVVSALAGTSAVASASFNFAQITALGEGCVADRPQVSDDGGSIVYATTCDRRQSRGMLYRHNVVTEEAAALVPNGCVVVGESAFAASGDGNFVALISSCDLAGEGTSGEEALFLLDIDGETFTHIATTGENCSIAAPTIDSSGRRVVFESDCDLTGANADGGSKLFVFDLPSGSIDQLTGAVHSCMNWDPQLSGDGSRLVFESDCEELTGTDPFRTGVVSYDFSSREFELAMSLPSGCGTAWGPRVDRDAARIVFTGRCNLTGANPDGSQEVFISDLAGGELVQVTDGTDPCFSSWVEISADGSTVGIMSNCDLTGGNEDNNMEIFLFDVARKQLRQVTSTESSEAVFCRNGDVVLNGDGSTIAFRSTCGGAGSLEALVIQVVVGQRATTDPGSGGDGCQVTETSARASWLFASLLVAVGIRVRRARR